MDARLVRASRLLSLVLRHRPDRLGLVLDEGGWVAVDDLLAGARREGIPLDRETLDRVVRENDKRRFALSDDGRRIRASQGHSMPVELGLQPEAPPETLYHGTSAGSVEAIRRDGLRAGRRTHVHLSANTATATTVGRRHGRPVVLTVAAGAMHRAGHEFVRSANGVWLVRHVPPEFLAPA